MDGVVTDGRREGSPVHAERQLLDPATFTFAGEFPIARDKEES